MESGSVDNTLRQNMNQHLISSYQGNTCENLDEKWNDVSKTAKSSMIMENGINYCLLFFYYSGCNSENLNE